MLKRFTKYYCNWLFGVFEYFFTPLFFCLMGVAFAHITLYRILFYSALAALVLLSSIGLILHGITLYMEKRR